MDKPKNLDQGQGKQATTPDIAADAPQWVLVFVLQPGKTSLDTKKTFKIHKRRLIIGSALSSDVRIQDASVSNVHAVVELDDKNVPTIYDMASQSGISINGKKTLSQTIKTGDDISIGNVTLGFSLQPLQEASATIPTHAVQKTGQRKLFLNEKEDFRPLILEDERNVIEIFDYPTSGELALQICQYWQNLILNISHFTEQKPVNIGEQASADFLVPGFSSPFPFISFENGECQLTFTEEMDGIVRTKQKLISIADLKAEKRETGPFRLSLKASDFVKLQVNGITFFISFCPEPPRLKPQKLLERDPFFFKIWSTSLLLSLLLIITAANVNVEKKLDIAEVPPRVATIIFKPITQPVKLEKQKITDNEKKVSHDTQPHKPKQNARADIKNQSKAEQAKSAIKNSQKNQLREAGGDQGEGARAKGQEGRKGSAKGVKSDIAMSKSRGNVNASSPAKGQGAGKGVVESLAGDLSGAISKSLSAGGKGADAAAGRLKGYGGFTTEGEGGLGQIGKGAGGGGESLDVAGAGTKGLGEGAVGKGLGAIGEGGNILGTGRGRPSIEIGGAQETIIVGGLDRDLIDQIIQKHRNQLRYCYEKEANAGKPDLRGRILTKFVISASGRVSSAGVENSTMGNSAVENCVVGVIQRIIFPEPLGGGIVEVSYPFTFTPAGVKE